MLRAQGIYCHSVPNEAAGAVSSKRQLGRLVSLKAAGLTAGVGDLVVWWPSGIGYLEVKTPKGRQSPKQKDFEQACIAYNVPYDVGRSVDEAVALIAQYGTP
jgi:hypothetical protein